MHKLTLEFANGSRRLVLFPDGRILQSYRTQSGTWRCENKDHALPPDEIDALLDAARYLLFDKVTHRI